MDRQKHRVRGERNYRPCGINTLQIHSLVVSSQSLDMETCTLGKSLTLIASY